MRSTILFGVLVLVSLVGAGTLAAHGSSYVSTDKQWSIVNFRDPVRVKGELVMGPVLLVHDNAKMAAGEPCTTFYQLDRTRGPKDAIVSFHCIPRRAGSVAATTLTTIPAELGCKRLIEFQIAGDSEAHGIPAR